LGSQEQVIAFDTNIIVRFLVGDDKHQTQIAYELLAGEAVCVSLAVLMETEWVLRKTYGFSVDQIHGAFFGLLGLEHVTATEPVLAQRVLTMFGAGLGFADAVHLAQAQSATAFATFDRELVNKAQKINATMPVFTPELTRKDR
jgi:predicted nucleic-acid-binding protein